MKTALICGVSGQDGAYLSRARWDCHLDQPVETLESISVGTLNLLEAEMRGGVI